MLNVLGRSIPLAVGLVVCACTSPARMLESGGEVQVIETARPVHLEQQQPPVPALGLPILIAQPLAPELVYFEPLPLPARHVITASLFPATERTLNLVQRVDVEVQVEGGALGRREISIVFISPPPQNLVWERKVELIDSKLGETQLVQVSLPVSSTFLEDQQLFGTWQVDTLDDGVKLASATFALEE